MYHPLTSKTILKISTAQRRVSLPLVDHIRTCLRIVEALPVQSAPMKARVAHLSAEYTEQIRILEAITPEAHADFLASL